MAPWNGLGSAASGRSQKGTTAPAGWELQSNVVYCDGLEDDAFAAPDDDDGQAWFPRAWDITIPIYAADVRINRFTRGVPRFTVKVPLRHADLQVGDFVTVTDNIPIYSGRDGSTTDVVLEITSKEIDALSDSPGVVFELAWVREDGSGISVTPGFTVHIPQLTAQTKFKLAVTDTDGRVVTNSIGKEITMRVSRSGGEDT